MTSAARNFLLLAACSMLAACSLPRGAALTSQVLTEQDSANPSFQVVQVTRAVLPDLSRWPQGQSTNGAGWPRASAGPRGQTIRGGDRISIMIWDNEENSLLMSPGARTATMPDLAVSQDGTVFVPYIEHVSVRGMTAEEARSAIQAALVQIAPQAQVQLTVQSGQANAVDVVAGVPKPGVYPLDDQNTTVLTVLSLAGGIPTGMRNPLVRLIRDGTTYEIPAERLLAEPGLNASLRGQDTLLIEEDKRYFTALGASSSERLVPFDRERITALEAISIIGGLIDLRADPKGVLVLRDYPRSELRQDGKGPAMPQVVFALDLTTADGLFAARNFLVQPKDTVLVTESPIVATATILGILNGTVNVANTAGAIAN